MTKDRKYGLPMTDHICLALDERQHRYLKARAKIDHKTMADIARLAIDNAYKAELERGVDVVEIAENHGLL